MLNRQQSYFTQAPQVAAALGIRLTSKQFTTKPSASSAATARPFPFAGFPVSQRDKYFRMLIDQNASFVVVEEAESSTKGEAKTRYVSRRYTPGTLCNEPWQGTTEARYLLAIAFDDAAVDVAYIDISTDRAVTCKRIPGDELEHELTRLAPVEIVLDASLEPVMRDQRPSDAHISQLKALLKGTDIFLSYVNPPTNTPTSLITTHLSACLLDAMPTLLPPTAITQRSHLAIDASTLQGLEVRHSLRSTRSGAQHSRHGTLISVIKRTLTASGTRLLVQTLTQPSACIKSITHRHALVQAFLDRPTLREDLRAGMAALEKTRGTLGEVARILQRFSSGTHRRRRVRGAGITNARDLVDLRDRLVGIRRLVARVERDVRGEGEAVERLRVFVQGHRDLTGMVEMMDGAVSEAVFDATVEEGEEEEAEAGQGRGGVWWLKPS